MSHLENKSTSSNEDLCKPSCSQDDGGNIDQSTIDSSKIKNTECKVSLKTIERVIKCLRSNDDGVKSILKNFLNVVEFCDEKRKAAQQLISSILFYSENSSLEEIDSLYIELNNLILSEPLRNLILDKNALTEISVTDVGGCSVICSALLNKNNTTIKVAIKQSTSTKTDKILKHEATILSRLNHPNIIKIFGIVKDPFRLVMEYMPHGALYKALKTKVYSDEDMLKAILEIASGMEYLAAKKIVHRDLAIRNIFVDKRYHCKIGDFGFSCYADEVNTVSDPIKDMNVRTNHDAPEISNAKKYTTKSDVFAMGILMREIYEISGNHKYLISDVIRHFVMHQCECYPENFIAAFSKPQNMPERIHELITGGLLDINPERRPTFSKIKEVVSQMLK